MKLFERVLALERRLDAALRSPLALGGARTRLQLGECRRLGTIVDWIEARPNQSGIIYCLSRKNTEDVAAKLKAKGIAGGIYTQTTDVERAD